MTRPDIRSGLTVLTLLLVCICLPGWVEADTPRPRSAPAADKPPAAVALCRKGLPAAEVVRLTNPTPLSDELYRAVLISCTTYDVPECLALGLIEVESGFDTEAVSPKGCYGLCQLNPEYHPGGLNPAQNIDAGMRYLGSLLERYRDVGAALTAYNAGRDTGSREYANKVLAAAEKWEEVYMREDTPDPRNDLE